METVRLRAGAYGVGNLLVATPALLGMAVVLVVAVGATATGHGGDRARAALGLTFCVLGLVAFAGWWLSAVSALRPVLVQPGADGWVSLPVLSRLRPARVVVALRDVRTVELEYLSQPRDGRWQLVVRAGNERVATDSVTSQRKEHVVRGTPAYDVVRQLRRYVVEAQTG